MDEQDGSWKIKDEERQKISDRARAGMMERVAQQREAQPMIGSGMTLNDALDLALKEIPPVVAAQREGQYSKYAQFADIVQHVAPKLRQHSIRWRFGVERVYSFEFGGGSRTIVMSVYCELIHMRSGLSERTYYETTVPKLDPQGFGGAFTYAKRASFLAALGFATSDDPADDDGASSALNTLDTATSDRVQAITKAIEDIKAKGEVTGLPAWRHDPKTIALLQRLSPGELMAVRDIYQAAEREMLSSAEDDDGDGKPAKPKSAKPKE